MPKDSEKGMHILSQQAQNQRLGEGQVEAIGQGISGQRGGMLPALAG